MRELLRPSFYEFFAGGGMARAGLGPGWQCLFANDIDPKKAISYETNWGSGHLYIGDVSALTTGELPGVADLVWASFPCQDLSLAGSGAGLDGNRSGTFWPFWSLVKALGEANRSPRLVVLENVYGALSSNEGKDFNAICSAMTSSGYRFGAVVIDASLFVPQSRPRLFIIGVHNSSPIPQTLTSITAKRKWHPAAMVEAYHKLSDGSKNSWVWWNLPTPSMRTSSFADLVEDEPKGVTWHSEAETERLLSMMTAANLAKVEAAKKAGCRQIGTIYKRTRANGPNGVKMQRAEVRFDSIAGCLRTPTGGSSRQIILIVEGSRVKSRLLSPREAARLMGLPDSYNLPKNYNDAYHLVGDGLVVPVVRFLAQNILEPLITTALPLNNRAA